MIGTAFSVYEGAMDLTDPLMLLLTDFDALNDRGKALAGKLLARELGRERQGVLVAEDGLWDLSRLESDEDFRGFAEALRRVMADED
jgi:hypothetical protein